MRYSQIIFLIILILWLATGTLYAAQPKVIVVLWHDLQWADTLESSFIKDNQAAVGLMNTRVGGGALIPGSYLTLASGSRAYGVNGAARLLHGSQLYQGMAVKEVYELRTGEQVNDDIIVNPEIAQIQQAASQARYPLQVGYLAEILMDAGLKIGAFGNSDTADEIARWAGVVAMDSLGKVAHGDVSPELLVLDPTYPTGRRTNYSVLLESISASQLDVVIVDLGDPYRFSTQQTFFLPEEQEIVKKRIVAEAWSFTNQLHQTLPNANLIILSAYSGESRAAAKQWIAPFISVGLGPGLLTSATTRWPGIVTNIDLAPTVLNILGLPKGDMIGRPAEVGKVQNSKDAVLSLISLEKRLFLLGNYRSKILRNFVGFQIVLYLLSLALLIVPQKMNPNLIMVVQLSLLICLSLPLLILLMPLSWVLSLVTLLVLIVVFLKVQDYIKIIMGIALATAGLLLLDVLRGSWWIRFSFLGYDALAGARYYGIGNEYMGILVGALIMGWTILRGYWDVRRGWIDLLIFLASSVIIAAPQWGTNVGGAITAVVGFGVAWLGIKRINIRLSTFLYLTLLVVLVLGLLMVIDFGRPENVQSHIGQTVSQIKKLGVKAVFQIINRKLAMNYTLFRYSIWSRALIVALLVMAGNLLWPNKYLHWLRANYPDLAKGLVGTIAASITALLVNDSGVVAAATCILFAATTMLILGLALKHDLLPSQPDV